jgi:hypothetical protein
LLREIEREQAAAEKNGRKKGRKKKKVGRKRSLTCHLVASRHAEDGHGGAQAHVAGAEAAGVEAEAGGGQRHVVESDARAEARDLEQLLRQLQEELVQTKESAKAEVAQLNAELTVLRSEGPELEKQCAGESLLCAHPDEEMEDLHLVELGGAAGAKGRRIEEQPIHATQACIQMSWKRDQALGERAGAEEEAAGERGEAQVLEHLSDSALEKLKAHHEELLCRVDTELKRRKCAAVVAARHTFSNVLLHTFSKVLAMVL